ncbi:MAG: TonB family protein [Bacteroidetes bacterium]|nr:TonB family protein [Bacteroidota bacterium]
MRNKLNLFILIILVSSLSCSSEKSITNDSIQENSVTNLEINKDDIELNPSTLPSIKGGLAALYKVLDYPVELRKAKIEGEVIFMFAVYIDGSIGEIVEISSPHPKLSEEVKRILKKVQFIPATKDDIIVNAVFTLKLTFVLQS